MRWYVLQVNGGKEQQIVKQLRELGIHALAPIEERLIRSKGVWNTQEYIIFTNYVFIETDFNAETWYKVTGLQDVVKWLGDKKDPTPITYMEAEWIRLLGNEGNMLTPSTVKQLSDGTYEIVDGILLKFKNQIKRFNKRQGNCEVVNPTTSIEGKTFKLSVNYIDNDTNKEEMVDTSHDFKLEDIQN